MFTPQFVQPNLQSVGDSTFPVTSVSISPAISIRRYRTQPQQVLSILGDESALAPVVASTEIEPGVYEGGFTCWQGSEALCRYLTTLPIAGKRVIELGCGHALPGIQCSLMGASKLVFQDFNEEVLRLATIPNLALNARPGQSTASLFDDALFIASSWADLPAFLQANADVPHLSQYDYILAAEVVYRESNFESLAQSIISLLSVSPDGQALVSGRVTYFGVGGGTDAFSAFISSKVGGNGEKVLCEEVSVSENLDENILKITLQR
ncbi:putative Histidine protein methyltransferase 1 like protein [Blattamonas nauphoetae]|uniref:protein-histidine N-methyltransferase n=1 Tax=Blattamonas nauphoetae TaxID=2049346 RepID=A0ABQ9XD39_9EUKA|nr:putative Histidine protein methyltransferase 1 like protein [Blattamonas nauphoetae]